MDSKRSVIRITEEIKKLGMDARFVQPIHDELVFSVHRDHVIPYIEVAKSIMTTHPDLFQSCVLDATASIGLTFEPYSSKATFGQIELDELPGSLGIGEPNGKATNDNTKEIIDYLFTTRNAA